MRDKVVAVHEQGLQVDVFLFQDRDPGVSVDLVADLAFAPALGGHAWEHFVASIVFHAWINSRSALSSFSSACFS